MPIVINNARDKSSYVSHDVNTFGQALAYLRYIYEKEEQRVLVDDKNHVDKIDHVIEGPYWTIYAYVGPRCCTVEIIEPFKEYMLTSWNG